MLPLGELFEYVLLATSSLFIIIDPISLIPTFLAITQRDTPAQRIRMAQLACVVAAGVLLTFAFVGKRLFALLGITLPSVGDAIERLGLEVVRQGRRRLLPRA